MLTIPLDINSKIPLYEQIYIYIKNEVCNGDLKAGEKLPSARNLAAFLQVSRSTVDLAFHQLLSEGYIEAKPRSGFYVCNIGGLLRLNNQKEAKNKGEKEAKKKYLYDFSPVGIDVFHFPYRIWRKLSNQCMNELYHDLFQLGSNQGDEELRSSIASYLHASRGVHCSAAQIIVGAGMDYLLQLLSLLFSKKNKIAIENPAYMRAYHILSEMGFTILPIDVDQSGICIDQLSKMEADIVYVTPSHQYPLGIVMPIKRRRELLSWAFEKEERYIIEDDHDSDFRYNGKPIPSLQGSDRLGCVIYMGTFSRAIAPAIRVSYMVLPEKLYLRYLEHSPYFFSTVSRIDQAILHAFIKEGHFERHLNKMRKVYKSRHDCLMKALKIFGKDIRISGENAGVYLVVEFLKVKSECELIEMAAKNNILLCGLNQFYLDWKKSEHPTVLLGFANLCEDEIIKAVSILKGMIDG